MYLGVGANNNTKPVVSTCPHCSYLWDGKCIVCEDGDPHPGCEGCVDGRPEPAPWYKSDLFVSIIAATVVAVTSSLIIVKLTGMSGGQALLGGSGYRPNRKCRCHDD